MSSPADPVRKLLERVDQTQPPTIGERRRIEQQMWDAVDTPSAYRPDAHDDDSVELVPLDLLESLTSKSRRLSGRVLAVAAAVLLVVVGSIAIGTSGDEGTTIEFWEGGPEVRFSATIGELPVSFVVAEPAVVSRSGEDFVVLRATDSVQPATQDPGSLGGQVVLARPIALFSDLEPEDWFEQNGIQAQPVLARFEGELIEAWSLVVPDSAVDARGCRRGEPCIAFAELKSGETLSLEAGFDLNSLRLIPVADGGQPLVLFAIQQGPLQGPSDDPIGRLKDEILATLETGE